MAKKETTNFSVEIKETSKELSDKERIMMKDVTDASKLDEVVTADEPLVITPVAYAVLSIHNEKADDKDYENYILLDELGNKYVTGSNSFWSSFMNIYEEMKDETEEWSIKVSKKPSKNYSGKEFITCSII